MSDNKKKTSHSATSKPTNKLIDKRPSTVTVPQTSRTRAVNQSCIISRKPSSLTKKDLSVIRPKSNGNTTILGSGESTSVGMSSELEDGYKQIAYGKYLRAMLEDCLVTEKIEREQSELDFQMGQLASRFQQTILQLDKTNRRVKDIVFIAEQERLLDLKCQDLTKFYDLLEQSNTKEVLEDLNSKEKAALNHLELRNVDFGYNQNTGHKQLLDAVNETLEGLEAIKKSSQLDINKFKELEKSRNNLGAAERSLMDLDDMKKQFEKNFPTFGDKLLKETSDAIAKMLESDNDDDED